MAVSVAGKSVKELKELRAELINKAQAYHNEHADSWAAENDTTFSEYMSDADAYGSAAKRLEAIGQNLAAVEGARPPQNDPQQRPGNPQGAESQQSRMISVRDGYNSDGSPRYVQAAVGARGGEDYQKNFAAHLQTGRMIAGLQMNTGVQDGISRYATLQSDNAERAGYLVASEQFAAEMLKEVDDLLFIRRYATIHTVREASSLGIRKRTGRLSTFDWTSELEVAAQDAALKYGKRVLTPHHLTGQVRMSRDLVRRSIISAESEVRGEMGRDAGEVMEDAYLTGTGDRQPLGVFTASPDGISTDRDVTTGGANAITADGLIGARYALKSQYRNGTRGSLRWLFHRNTIELIAKLKDANNQYLFRTGAGFASDNGMPEDTLLGIPVDESERVPNTVTDGNYIGLLANWRYYEIADALDMEVQVLYELFALTNEIGYIGRLKTDGMPTLEEAFVRLEVGA